MMTGVEAEALIAPSSAFVESVLEGCDSISFDDVCSRIIPFCDNLVAEKNFFELQDVIFAS